MTSWCIVKRRRVSSVKSWLAAAASPSSIPDGQKAKRLNGGRQMSADFLRKVNPVVPMEADVKRVRYLATFPLVGRTELWFFAWSFFFLEAFDSPMACRSAAREILLRASFLGSGLYALLTCRVTLIEVGVHAGVLYFLILTVPDMGLERRRRTMQYRME